MKEAIKDYQLFLDDIRVPEEVHKYTTQPIYDLYDWEIVRNYEEFVDRIKEMGVPWTISFDHDLGFDVFLEKDYEDYDPDTEKTGYDCAKWLLNHCLDNNLQPPQIVMIHSQNVVGSVNIKSLFTTYNKIHGDVKDSRRIVNYTEHGTN